MTEPEDERIRETDALSDLRIARMFGDVLELENIVPSGAAIYASFKNGELPPLPTSSENNDIPQFDDEAFNARLSRAGRASILGVLFIDATPLQGLFPEPEHKVALMIGIVAAYSHLHKGKMSVSNFIKKAAS